MSMISIVKGWLSNFGSVAQDTDLKAGLPEDFDENIYLLLHPDVHEAVHLKQFKSGAHHWQAHGRLEGRRLRAAIEKQASAEGAAHGPSLVFDERTTELAIQIGVLRHQIKTMLRSNYATKLQALLGAPRKLPTTTLYPIRGLEPNGMAHGWRSLSVDPVWLLPIGTSARYLRIIYRGKIVASRYKRTGGKWQLFYDSGSGFSEQLSRSVYFQGSDIRVDVIIKLPDAVITLRVDPADFPCEFIVEKFEITAYSGVSALLEIAADRVNYLRRRELFWATSRIAAKQVLSGQVSDGLRLLFGLQMPPSSDLYQRWLEERPITSRVRSAFVNKGAELLSKPTFSIIMPTYNSPIEFLEKAIQSVLEQTYPGWELCVADDGSTKAEVRRRLEHYAALDKRIKTVFLEKNSGIPAASNAALALASGDYIALLDHDDELAPHAFYAMAAAINANGTVDWLYSDEDKIDEKGNRSSPLFKPDWSPIFFLSCMYTCHLGVYRRELAVKLGGFRDQFSFAQDYDLALRFASVTDKIVHVPDVLYHWRTLRQSTASGAEAKPEAERAARRALQSFVDRKQGVRGTVELGAFRGIHKVQFEIKGSPLVSIAIPSAGHLKDPKKNGVWFVLDLIISIYEKTSYKNIEIIVAENGDFEPILRQKLDQLGVKRVFYKARTFNMSDKMNLVVGETKGEYVILLNDDMMVIDGGWVNEMLSWCQLDEVAAVGAKLLFPDGRIQHAGVVLFEQGPSHIYYLHDRTEVGLVGSAVVPREYSAVTGACLMVRRRDYINIGGFDPAFRINYNDIDFCLRLTQGSDRKIICAPDAKLYHYESVSKDDSPHSELDMFNMKWKDKNGKDPFYSIHLSQYSTACEINMAITSLETQYGLPCFDRNYKYRTAAN
jgi:glycosyltransferase involved in cell wall biosynthesis